MTSTASRGQKYNIRLLAKGKKGEAPQKVGRVKRTAEDGQEVTCIDYGDGVDEKVMKAGSLIMKAKRQTRYKKRKKETMYWFYDCKCGWGTGHKFQKRTYEMLVRLHRKRCDGKIPAKKEGEAKCSSCK